MGFAYMLYKVYCWKHFVTLYIVIRVTLAWEQSSSIRKVSASSSRSTDSTVSDSLSPLISPHSKSHVHHQTCQMQRDVTNPGYDSCLLTMISWLKTSEKVAMGIFPSFTVVSVPERHMQCSLLPADQYKCWFFCHWCVYRESKMPSTRWSGRSGSISWGSWTPPMRAVRTAWAVAVSYHDVGETFSPEMCFLPCCYTFTLM